jgi:hypothetical protein
MANPFLGKAEREKAGVKLVTKRGRWRHLVPVEMDGKEGRRTQ